MKGFDFYNTETLFNVGVRVYHGIQHTLDVMRRIEKLEEKYPILNNETRKITYLAAYFHDIIYDINGGFSEMKSASVAKLLLKQVGIPDSIINGVGSVIEGTRPLNRLFNSKYITEQCDEVSWNTAMSYLNAVDMMDMGAPLDIYMDNANKIMNEALSNGVSLAVYVEKRIEFLVHISASKSLRDIVLFMGYAPEHLKRNIEIELDHWNILQGKISG